MTPKVYDGITGDGTKMRPATQPLREFSHNLGGKIRKEFSIAQA
jgi:hypothetical protein